jgi:hypothetical protein
MANSFEGILQAVRRDVATVNVHVERFELFVLSSQNLDDARQKIEEPESWLLVDEPGRSRVLLLLNGNVTALDDGPDDPESLLVEITSTVQDFVADETNAPWPVTRNTADRDDDVVLDVAMSSCGKASWMYRGEVFCRIGELRSILRG